MMWLITASVASSSSFPLVSSKALAHIVERSSKSISLLSNRFEISVKYFAVSGSTLFLNIVEQQKQAYQQFIITMH
jgi:hypothetical protein